MLIFIVNNFYFFEGTFKYKLRSSETCFVQLRVTGGMKTVERALEEYTNAEVMDGDNKCECEE